MTHIIKDVKVRATIHLDDKDRIIMVVVMIILEKRILKVVVV